VRPSVGSRASARIAQPRSPNSRPGDSPRYGYYNRYYYTPWYFGGNLGYYSSLRYRYGAGLWGYPYDYWYGPYGYVPFSSYYNPYATYYDPYFSYGYGDGGYAGREDRGDDRSVRTGSVRLRANPRTAKVYVDGALVGTVDEFDGLSNHLSLEVGVHQLELRADGYRTFSTEISVEDGKTMTERANLKKQ